MKKKSERAVVVTTEFRGVFFGYVENDKETPTKIVLTDARNCVYWSAATKGVLGLAADGPGSDCRIGPKIPRLEVWKITAILDCTEKAVAKWEAAPWS